MVKGLQVQLSGGSNNVKAVELSIPGCLKELRTAVRSALRPHLDGKKFSLTNFTKDVKDDEGVQALSEGEKLWAVILDPSNHVVPTKERVTFQPHPNTLTMAGELEYWAAQGRSPLPYALSELIDNALRATRNNRSSRRIVITLAISGGSTPSAGLISVWDNGCGMTKRELNDWAVMNLSMEDRGEQPLEPDVGHGPTQRNGPERFLSGNLSYFGVGSKNAAFFMGGCTKVVTKSAQSSFVHELSLAAGELEERYRKQQDVYAEDLMHRSPRDASTLAAIESGFEPLAKAWVAAEAMADTSEEEGAGKSFTRVLIGQIKPNILCQIADQSAMKQLRRDLSHLYHYYLHGPQGSRSHGQTGSQPRDGTLPEITVEGVIGGRAAWSVNLADVTDDLESQYLQAQRAELQFSLMVPGKGTVAGALYYFPFQDERETLPAEGAVASQPEPITTYNMTQQPMASQLPTQAPPQSGGADAADEDGNSLWQRSRAPLFSAFWQGRLIPGARIESLPFIEAVRVKRSSASRDALPDEAFMRLRGSLFFGPAFLVTRNKLTFRDNLQELLASSSPGDRTNLERKFREWLTKCHATLDKRIRFVGLADPAMQAAVRSSRGEDVTAFARIEDGSRSVTQGDVVRLNVKPALMGMVLYFSVQQAVRTEGVYANGSVAVRPLPEEVHGTAAERTVPLRRLEGGPVQRQELDDYLAKELLKVPSSLRLEPIRLATGNAVELTAGASIPATGVTVLNGSGQHVIRGFLAGEKQSFSVVQRLWRLHAQPGEGNAQPEAAPAEEEPQRPPKKRKKPSKGQKAAEKTPEPVADMLAGVLIIEVHNHTPNKDCFRFERIEKGLKKAGTYRLDYELQPCLPGKGPLTISTQLTVSSGPLACFDLQGEGRTLLASREFMLGEHLPCLQLMPRDGCGNKLDSEVERLKDVSVEVVSGPTDDGSAPEVIQDLQASFQVAEDQGRVLIKSAQVLGCNLGSVTSVFAGSPTPNPVSIPQAQQQPASQQIIAAETVQMRFCVRGLEPQLIPLRLRPGAPVGLRLLPAHPFSAQADEAAAVMTQLPPERTAALALTLPSGGALPGFHVQAIDAWGNAAGPTDALPCDVTVDCNALSPAQASFSICASGRAYVDGLVGASGGAALGRRVPLTFSIVCRPADADAATAVAAAGPPQPLVCALEVEPSTAPAAILLLHDGQPLPRRELEGEDGETETVFVVEDIAAGSELAGLAMQCVDAAGRPVAEGTPGKVRATWIQGTKKLKFGPDGTFALLDIRVKEDVTEVETYDVKFKSAGPAPEVLEATLMVLKVPASAHVWQLRLDEAASSQARSQDDVDMRNGCPFSLEVEALDRFGNRCPGGAAGALPAPLLSADSERKLEYDADAWARSWSPQGSGEVLSVSVTLRGRPGLVRMHVRDVAGPAGSSALTPDTLELKLAAGQMSGLAFEGPPSLACGMRHVLPALRVIAVDDFGNRTTCPAFEVSLAPSALAADGSGVAAAITAPGGNKAKVKDGEAVFKNVRIEADSPGAYTLRVKSASRKVAGDASVELQLTATNAVKALALREDSLPLEGCQAGSSLTLFAEVATEDEAALDGEAAAQGLALRLTPPGSSRSDDIVISPSEGGGAQEQGIYAFCTEALVASGEWTAVVEYTEQRPELSKALTKREAVLRSTAATFQVLPGPAVALALDCGAAGERLAATNGADARERLLLAGAALQLQDEHGNAAAAGGHRVRLSLHWPPSNQDGNGSELPKLEVEGAAVRKTDECGRAFFGDVSLGEGSGRVAPDENAGGNARQGGAIELVLVAEVAGLGTADTKQWVRAWSCSVLFSDNVASFAAVKELTDRHAALSMERDRLQDRLSTTGRAAQAANKELKARTKEVAECRRPLGRNAPETVAAAEAALSRLQNGAHEPQAQQPQVEARFGDPSARMTEALRRCLALEDEEVVGCVAQLATVSDGALARLLSASYCGMMPLLVTKTPAAQKRVTQHLAKHKCEVPDMLSMTMCAPFTGKDGASPGFDRASKRAKELSAAACDGTDPPLALPLPHTRILHSRKGGASSEDLELGATDWPEGCLGYAFNLLRPTQPGHRRQLMFSAFGTQLVFETLEDASKYREFVTQVLRSGMPQVVTLRDFRCITGIGVVRGTSWQVPTLEETHYRFGTTAGAGGSSGRGEGDEAEEAALEALLDALRAKDEAAERHQAARAEAESTEVQYRGELEELEVQIRELDAQLSSQHAPAGGARQRAKKRRSAGEGKDISVAEDVEVQNVGGEPQQDRRSKRRR